MHAVIADRELDALQDVQVLHALRGRLRVHLVTWSGKGQSRSFDSQIDSQERGHWWTMTDNTAVYMPKFSASVDVGGQ